MNILFIVNPKSGKHTADIQNKISHIKAVFSHAQVALTKAPGHATELAREAALHNFEAVIAVGGDGTLNETARGVVNTLTPMGIIPNGSGNGFARELGMSLIFKKALNQLRRTLVSPCDIGLANEELFLNLAGVGIEAEIAWQFMRHGQDGMRGKWPYFQLGAKTVFSYQPETFELEVDGKKEFCCPLSLVFANGRQYGCNFKVAPQASLTDGFLDMVTMQNLPKWKLAASLPSFFSGKKPPFNLTQTSRVKQVRLSRAGVFPYHIDGEPRQANETLTISVQPGALKILLPEKK